MKKILLGLVLVFGFVLSFGFSNTASAQVGDNQDVPMSGLTAQVRLSTSNGKVSIYRSTMSADGQVTGLTLLCQYTSFPTGIKDWASCNPYIGNDSTGLVLVALSKNEDAGGIMGSIQVGPADVYQLSDIISSEIVSASTVSSATTVFSIPQVIAELNNTPSQFSANLGENGDSIWGDRPYLSTSQGIQIGVPPQGGLYNYKIFKINNSGAPLNYTAPTVTFTANGSVGPVTLPSWTTSATLAWNATAGSACTASTTTATPLGSTNYSGTSTVWAGSKAVSGSFSATPLLTNTSYKFKIDCASTGGTHTIKNVIVNVSVPLTASVSFTNPSQTVTVNTLATFNFTPINAGSCTMVSTSTPAGPTGNTTGNSWSATPTVSGTFTYKVICDAINGAIPAHPEATATLQVNGVMPPPTPSVTLTPVSTTMTVGDSVTLTWDSANATSCTTTGGVTGWPVTNGAFDGTFVVPASTPVGTYTFSISCTGAGGTTSVVTATVTVTALPPAPVASVDLTVSSSSVLVGSTPSPTLTWNLANVGTCTSVSTPAGWPTPTITGGNSTGTWSVPTNLPVSYTFTITCTPALGATAGTLTDTVTVDIYGNLGQNPTVNLQANNASTVNISVNEAATLTWISSHVNSCNKTVFTNPAGLYLPADWTTVAGNNSGLLGWSTGTLTLPGTYLYHYRLLCTHKFQVA